MYHLWFSLDNIKIILYFWGIVKYDFQRQVPRNMLFCGESTQIFASGDCQDFLTYAMSISDQLYEYTPIGILGTQVH